MDSRNDSPTSASIALATAPGSQVGPAIIFDSPCRRASATTVISSAPQLSLWSTSMTGGRFDALKGSLGYLDTLSRGGTKPRDFGFSPRSRWLVAANQDSDSCILFQFKPSATRLSERWQRLRSILHPAFASCPGLGARWLLVSGVVCARAIEREIKLAFLATRVTIRCILDFHPAIQRNDSLPVAWKSPLLVYRDPGKRDGEARALF